MADSKHTPGEWSLPHFAKPEVNCECGYVLTDGHMGAVCTVHASGDGDWQKTGDNPKFAEAVANAYLIHAAPSLLSIAKRWAAIDGGAWHVERHAREKVELLADTHAAIALATPSDTHEVG